MIIDNKLMSLIYDLKKMNPKKW